MPQEATSYLKSTMLTIRNICEAITVLPPQMKQELSDCLRKKIFDSTVLPPQMKQELLNCLRKTNLLFGVSSQEASSTHWFIKCFELLLGWSNSPRRYLASESHRQIAPSHDPYLASAPAAPPTGHGAAASNPAPASSPSPNQPTQKNLHYKQDMTDSLLPSPSPAIHKHYPPSPPRIYRHYPSKAHDEIDKETFAAVVATAIATFCFVAMLFFCWCCFKGSNNKIGPRGGKRDERPLLHLNLSASMHFQDFLSFIRYNIIFLGMC